MNTISFAVLLLSCALVHALPVDHAGDQQADHAVSLFVQTDRYTSQTAYTSLPPSVTLECGKILSFEVVEKSEHEADLNIAVDTCKIKRAIANARANLESFGAKIKGHSSKALAAAKDAVHHTTTKIKNDAKKIKKAFKKLGKHAKAWTQRAIDKMHADAKRLKDWAEDAKDEGMDKLRGIVTEWYVRFF